MGFSTVLSTAIMALILLMMFTIVYKTNIYQWRTVYESINDLGDNHCNRLRTGISISDVRIEDSNIIMNISNTGHNSIFLRDFKYIDLIVKYKPVVEDYRIEYLLYNREPKKGYWAITRTFMEAINPLRPSTGSGALDPCEIMEVNASLSSAIDKNYTVVIVVATPDGYTAIWSGLGT